MNPLPFCAPGPLVIHLFFVFLHRSATNTSILTWAQVIHPSTVHPIPFSQPVFSSPIFQPALFGFPVTNTRLNQPLPTSRDFGRQDGKDLANWRVLSSLIRCILYLRIVNCSYYRYYYIVQYLVLFRNTSKEVSIFLMENLARKKPLPVGLASPYRPGSSLNVASAWSTLEDVGETSVFESSASSQNLTMYINYSVLQVDIVCI